MGDVYCMECGTVMDGGVCACNADIQNWLTTEIVMGTRLCFECDAIVIKTICPHCGGSSEEIGDDGEKNKKGG